LSTKNGNPLYPFYENALKHPESLALWVDGLSYSYMELASEASRIAEWLMACNDRPGRVAILTNRSIASYLGILATGWIGACYVPLNPTFPEKRLLQIIHQARPEALVVGNECIPLLTTEIIKCFPNQIFIANADSVETHGQLIHGLDKLSRTAELKPPARVHPSAESYLVFTSGTTGTANVVAINAGNLNFALNSLIQNYSFDASDRFSQFFEISFDFSIMDIFIPWQVGASTHVVPSSQRLGPANFIREQQLTAWTCVPNMINLMDQMKMLTPGIFPSIRFSCFSGETLTATAAQKWQEATPNGIVVNLYGQTEAPIGSLVQTFSADVALTEETGGVAIGRTLPGTKVAIIDEEDNFVKQGELVIAGPHITTGYLNNPQRNAEKFKQLTHPDFGLQTWYCSGDLARQDENGIFHFLGRTDNELKISGYRIVSEEVEHYLRKVSGVHSVAATPWYNKFGTAEAFICFIVTPDNIDEQAIKKAMCNILPRPLVPRRIFAIRDLPLNANGKIDRPALAQLAISKINESRQQLP